MTKHYHAWRLWSIELPVDAEGWLEFCVRTWDSSNNTEPTYVRSAWKYVPASVSSVITNLALTCFLPSYYSQLFSWDLHVTSSCHRIKIYSVNKAKPATAKRLKELANYGESFEPLTKPIEFSLEPLESYLAIAAKYPREPVD
jgi:sulfite oxidase